MLTACDSGSNPASEPGAGPQSRATVATDAEREPHLEKLLVETYGESQGSYADMFLGDYNVTAEIDGEDTTPGIFTFSYDEENDRVVMTTVSEDGVKKSMECTYDLSSLGKNAFMQLLLCTPQDADQNSDGVTAFVELSFVAERGQTTLEGEGYLANDSERVVLATYSGMKAADRDLT